ncbi:MAG: glycerol-3-phosphate acyltransferase [Clostridia bacterium]|nr:glycerol-3-phosphate acyltransferase [Clostridia bacterium]
MKIFLCILIGYLLGSLNPAALISRLKHKNLRQHGTGNLGATNTMLVFGKSFGALVMIFDIAKAYIAFKCAKWLAPQFAWVAIAAGFSAIVGHCFPFYMSFRGGKGLAAFAGLVLAYDPLLFLFLLISGIALMIAVNHTFILPFYATVFFTFHVAITKNSIPMLAFAIASAMLIITMHFGNFIKAIKGEDKKIRELLSKKLLKRKK